MEKIHYFYGKSPFFNGKIHNFCGKSQFFWGKRANIWLMMMVNIWLMINNNLVGGWFLPL